MPEGDSLHRAAARLQVLVGQTLEVETPHPRAAVHGLAQRLSGSRLEEAEAVGKNLLFRFEGGIVLRSHLRMSGRWRVEPRGSRRVGTPWLVLRGAEHEAVLWNGPLLELVREPELLGRQMAGSADGEAAGTRPKDRLRLRLRLGPDILAEPPDLETMLSRLRGVPQEREVGDALLDQRLVAGIGNLWRAEALWEAGVSPWRPLRDASDDELRAVLEAAHHSMRAGVAGTRPLRHVYRRGGRPCRRCCETIRSHPQGDDARTAYWCPNCQE